jgi:hypothetical protein
VKLVGAPAELGLETQMQRFKAGPAGACLIVVIPPRRVVEVNSRKEAALLAELFALSLVIVRTLS